MKSDKNNSKLKDCEAELKEIQQIARLGRWELNLKTNTLIWSDTIFEIFEINPEEFGASYEAFIDAVHPEDREKVNQAYNQSLKDKKPYMIEHRLMMKDSRVKWVIEMCRTDYDETGNPVLSVGIVQDITDRKISEIQKIEAIENSRVSEERYRVLFNQSVEEIYLHDIEGNIVDANRTAYIQSGYSIEELVRMTVFDLLAENENRVNLPKNQILEAWNKWAPEQRITLEALHKKKDGTIYPVEITTGIIRYNNRNLMLAIVKDITDRKEAENRLLHSHYLMTYIIEHSRSAIAVHDRDLKYIYVSQRYLKDYRIEHINIIGKHHYDVFPDLPQKWQDIHQLALKGTISSAENDPFIRKDGTVDWTSWECRPWYEKDSSIGGIIIYTEVINEKKKAEEEREKLQDQLAQSRKLESIGRLAGGVAHDFNNMLGVILGHAELAIQNIKGEDPLFSDLEEIKKAAEHSAALTRQLLAFARKQNVIPRVINLNHTINGMIKMLKRLIGEDINLSWIPGSDLWNVLVDPSQVDQILANMCVNARDSIPGTGKITIETNNITLDTSYCEVHLELIPGEYCMLAVSDNGCGMDKETREKIFEPFFTTKNRGKGTGLGLSTVYGIIRQNNGLINVYSEPSLGSTFRIYLPRHKGEADLHDNNFPESGSTEGTETILLVEDETSIMTVTKAILERQGYTVHAASEYSKALKIAGSSGEKPQLLITDVIMPEINGKELAEKIMALCPGIKVLFMSGYTSNVIAHHGVLDPEVNFIQKPFTIKELSFRVRSILDTGN